MTEWQYKILAYELMFTGLQQLLSDCKGYGLLTTDEGSRVIQDINQKQAKNQGERALLNKLWGGKGYHACVRYEKRGFTSSSLSICLFVQPHPFLLEMLKMEQDDGFFDRFLIFVTRPKIYHLDVQKHSKGELETKQQTDVIRRLSCKIYEHHKDQGNFSV